MMKFKEGNKLICINNSNKHFTKEQFTIGKIYPIVNVHDRFLIINDDQNSLFIIDAVHGITIDITKNFKLLDDMREETINKILNEK